MVMEKVRPRLNTLSKLAPQLNKTTDLYMDELKEIEDKLQKLNLGIEVEDKVIQKGNRFTEVDADQEPTGISFYSVWMLGYGRSSISREWCLFVREYTVYSDDRGWCEAQTVPLLNASRNLRIAAADKIPALLEKIEKEVKGKIETLQKVTDKR